MSSSFFKQWWKKVKCLVYFMSAFLTAFIITYLVLNNFYDSQVYKVDTVNYLFENNVCEKMILFIPDTGETVEFNKCVFDNPLYVYFFDNKYVLSEFAYNKYVESTQNVLHMIIYIYFIFIGGFFTVFLYYTCGAFLFFIFEKKSRQVSPTEFVILQKDIPDERCVICLDNFLVGQRVNIHYQACKKVFHTACLDKYFDSSSGSTNSFKCPLCRLEFFS